MFGERQLVEGPARLPVPYGLFSVLTFREDADPHWQNGVEFETLGCDPVSGIGEPDCAPDESGGTVATGLPKNFAGAGVTGTADPFTVYGSFVCSPVGWSPEDAQARATELLLLREELRVEQALWTGDLGNDPNLDGAAEDINATGALDPSPALGALEKAIVDRFGQQGVIHMTRDAATILTTSGALVANGASLRTVLGTPVSAGGGYPGTGPAGVAAAAGTTWMFGTPALLGYRSEVFTSSNRSGDLLDRGENNMHAVAERSYVIGWDECDTLPAVRMNLACC